MRYSKQIEHSCCEDISKTTGIQIKKLPEKKNRKRVGLFPLNFRHFYLLIYLTDLLIGAED